MANSLILHSLWNEKIFSTLWRFRCKTLDIICSILGFFDVFDVFNVFDVKLSTFSTFSMLSFRRYRCLAFDVKLSTLFSASVFLDARIEWGGKNIIEIKWEKMTGQTLKMEKGENNLTKNTWLKVWIIKTPCDGLISYLI